MSEHSGHTAQPRGRDLAGWIGRVGGPALALAVYFALGSEETLPPQGKTVAAVGVLMAVYWMTEAMPLAATSLLPLVLFPLSGVLSFDQAAAPYANKFIFLFLGGFMIAAAIERWNLHRRMALTTVWAVGTRPANVVGGFMLATALLSMWISNTATTMLMLPIAMSTIKLFASKPDADRQPAGVASKEVPGVQDGLEQRLATCLLLAIAYSASIGGIATLIGTPPNAFLAGFLESRGMSIGFGQWMVFGVPVAAVMLAIAWMLLTRWIFPLRLPHVHEGSQMIEQELAKMGPISKGERIVLCVFGATAATWIARGPLTGWSWLTERIPAVSNLNDAIIALVGALVLFLVPVDAKRGVYALDWQSARRLPWGVLLLFGGGLSLAEAMSRSRLTEWIGGLVGQMEGLPVAALVVALVVIVILLTEITSNIATTTALLPVVYGVAVGLKAEATLLLIPTAVAASCAFMLPVATPPNAIVFGSGHVKIGQMVRAGFWLNLVGVILIPCAMYALGAWVFGVAP